MRAPSHAESVASTFMNRSRTGETHARKRKRVFSGGEELPIPRRFPSVLPGNISTHLFGQLRPSDVLKRQRAPPNVKLEDADGVASGRLAQLLDTCNVLKVLSNSVIDFYADLVAQGWKANSIERAFAVWAPFESAKSYRLLPEGQYKHHFIDVKEIANAVDTRLEDMPREFFEAMQLANFATFIHYIYQIPRDPEALGELEDGRVTEDIALAAPIRNINELNDARRVFLKWIVPASWEMSEEILLMMLNISTYIYTQRVRIYDAQNRTGQISDEQLGEKLDASLDELISPKILEDSLLATLEERMLSNRDLHIIVNRYKSIAEARSAQLAQYGGEWVAMLHEWPVSDLADDLLELVEKTVTSATLRSRSNAGSRRPSGPATHVHHLDRLPSGPQMDYSGMNGTGQGEGTVIIREVPEESTPRPRSQLHLPRNARGDQNTDLRNVPEELRQLLGTMAAAELSVEEPVDERAVDEIALRALADTDAQDDMQVDATDNAVPESVTRSRRSKRRVLSNAFSNMNLVGDGDTQSQNARATLKGKGRAVDFQNGDADLGDIELEDADGESSEGADADTETAGPGPRTRAGRLRGLLDGNSATTEPMQSRITIGKDSKLKRTAAPKSSIFDKRDKGERIRFDSQEDAEEPENGPPLTRARQGQGSIETDPISQQTSTPKTAQMTRRTTRARSAKSPAKTNIDNAQTHANSPHRPPMKQPIAGASDPQDDSLTGGPVEINDPIFDNYVDFGEDNVGINDFMADDEPQGGPDAPGSVDAENQTRAVGGDVAAEENADEEAPDSDADSQHSKSWCRKQPRGSSSRSQVPSPKGRAGRREFPSARPKDSSKSNGKKRQQEANADNRRSKALENVGKKRKEEEADEDEEGSRSQVSEQDEDDEEPDADGEQRQEEEDELKSDSDAPAPPRPAAKRKPKKEPQDDREYKLNGGSDYRYGIGTAARRRWTPEETKCFVDCLYKYAHLKANGVKRVYSNSKDPQPIQIFSHILQRHGPNGTKSRTLQWRNNMQLKDKVKSELVRMRREKQVIPYWGPILSPSFFPAGKSRLKVEKMPRNLPETEDEETEEEEEAEEEQFDVEERKSRSRASERRSSRSPSKKSSPSKNSSPSKSPSKRVKKKKQDEDDDENDDPEEEDSVSEEGTSRPRSQRKSTRRSKSPRKNSALATTGRQSKGKQKAKDTDTDDGDQLERDDHSDEAYSDAAKTGQSRRTTRKSASSKGAETSSRRTRSSPRKSSRRSDKHESESEDEGDDGTRKYNLRNREAGVKSNRGSARTRKQDDSSIGSRSEDEKSSDAEYAAQDKTRSSNARPRPTPRKSTASQKSPASQRSDGRDSPSALDRALQQETDADTQEDAMVVRTIHVSSDDDEMEDEEEAAALAVGAAANDDMDGLRDEAEYRPDEDDDVEGRIDPSADDDEEPVDDDASEEFDDDALIEKRQVLRRSPRKMDPPDLAPARVLDLDSQDSEAPSRRPIRRARPAWS
ncbi:hypothetical protein OC845_002519 [Tilletia horrida]|nr:hypothetical protein OC845_002519 [Tilletia horrida]